MSWAEGIQQKAKNTEKMDELGGRSPTKSEKHGKDGRAGRKESNKKRKTRKRWMSWAEEIQQKAKNTKKMDELGGRNPTKSGKHEKDG